MWSSNGVTALVKTGQLPIILRYYRILVTHNITYVPALRSDTTEGRIQRGGTSILVRSRSSGWLTDVFINRRGKSSSGIAANNLCTIRGFSISYRTTINTHYSLILQLIAGILQNIVWYQSFLSAGTYRNVKSGIIVIEQWRSLLFLQSDLDTDNHRDTCINIFQVFR